MTKHIKLFESFQKEQELEELKIHMIAERVFSNLKKNGIDFSSIGFRLYEQETIGELYEWIYEEVEPNAAELRAAQQGKQILTRPQLAVIYLYAKGVHQEPSDATEFIQVIPGLEGYIFQGLPKYQLNSVIAEVFGIDSDGTFTRTVNKFSNHITDNVNDPEVTRSEADYIKVRDAYYFLSRFGNNDIALALGDAVQVGANVDQRLDQAIDKQEKVTAKNLENQQRRKQDDLDIGRTVFNLRNDYARAFPNERDKYSRVVWNKATEENPNISLNRMWDSYLAYLRFSKLSSGDYPLNRPGFI
jgi:hypothetical protein